MVPPGWRRDLVAEVDLIEEVARLHGYDALPDEIRPYRPGTSRDAPLWTLVRAAARGAVGAPACSRRGRCRSSPAATSTCASLNPLAENEAHLRRTLLETLARRAEYNLAHMQGNVRLYEIGSAFTPRRRTRCRTRACAWPRW